MNGNDFLCEVLNSQYCPHGFAEIYEGFQLFQQCAIDTLLELHRICEKNKINYQLAFGSLLGVIRDDGQIPWDYDIDVVIPYTEKKKLLEALDRDLDPKFYYYCPEKNKRCRHVIMRIAPREYRTEALHVDVFYMIGTPETDYDRKKFVHQVRRVSEYRFGKLVNLREESIGSIRRYIRLLISKKLPTIMYSIRKIEDEYNFLCKEFPLDKSTVWVTADIFADWYEFPAYLMKETQLKKTTYGMVRIPKHYEDILRIEYGDYNEIPPLEQRINEVLYNYHRIIKYQKKDREDAYQRQV